MPKRHEATSSPDTARRLAAIDKELEPLRKMTRDVNRRAAAPIIDAAVGDGRIAADETPRWLERVDTFGVDTVRDLLVERRPNRQLARANAAAAQEITDATKRELEAVFGLGEGTL